LISTHVFRGKIHSSAIAIAAGLLLAWLGGELTGGKKGLSDITLFSGIALMGGGMFRDFAIIATAFGVKLDELKKRASRALALVVSTVLSFYLGAIVAWAFGYTDAVSMATIGGGAVTFIVGPVTGAALGASSDVIALSIAAGVIKSIAIMIVTPLVAKAAGLNSPAAAIVYGGLMGSTSGVAAGLAATDPKLVPYGAMTATFYTGLGCLLAPSALYLFSPVLLTACACCFMQQAPGRLMYSFQRMKPGQIAIQASLCTQEEEEIFRQKLLGDKPEHRIGFAFISGTSDELRNKLQRCVIGCALKNQIITRQESAIFTLCSLSRQALTHALTNTITGDHIRLKIALVSTSRWLAVAMYGEARFISGLLRKSWGFVYIVILPHKLPGIHTAFCEKR
jgi:malonate transporter MadM subunit